MLILYTMTAKGKPIVSYGDIKCQNVFIKKAHLFVFKLSVGP